MAESTQNFPEAQGGCQCGAVRYRVSAGPGGATLCHCRMCQRATGNAFAPLYEILSSRITWYGNPQEWASSNIAWRGFCAVCGTPLYYRSGEVTELMAGTLTRDFPFSPDDNCGVESRVSWLDTIAGLPDRPTKLELTEVVCSHQALEEA